jgi:hypothetical protein
MSNEALDKVLQEETWRLGVDQMSIHVPVEGQRYDDRVAQFDNDKGLAQARAAVAVKAPEALRLLAEQVMVLNQIEPWLHTYNANVPEEMRVNPDYAAKHLRRIQALLAAVREAAGE